MGESSNLAPRQVLAGWGLVVLLIPNFGEKIECFKKSVRRGKEVRDLIQTVCDDIDR